MNCSKPCCANVLNEADKYCSQCGQRRWYPPPPLKLFPLFFVAIVVGIAAVLGESFLGPYGITGKTLLYISPSHAQDWLHPTYYCLMREKWNNTIPDLKSGNCNCKATLDQCGKEMAIFEAKPAKVCYQKECHLFWVHTAPE